MSDDAAAPRVTEFSLFEQLEGDPWTVVLAVGFTDSDGNTGTGTIEFFVNGASSGEPLDLEPLFLPAALDTNATAGRFAVPIRFPEGASDGTSLRLGIQLLDATDLRSNCYSMRLDFDVTQVSMQANGPCWLATRQAAAPMGLWN